MAKLFQSTRPLRGATSFIFETPAFPRFQSTRPLRGATKGGGVELPLRGISIHAPLAGRDVAVGHGGGGGGISIHAPLAGRDAMDSTSISVTFAFQSTRPLRGATRSA